MGELFFHRVSPGCLLGDRLVRAWPSYPASPATQSAALSAGSRRGVVFASPTAGVGLSGASVRVGCCACLRREFSGEPDAGNPHLRFDEGRVGRGFVAFSPTLPALLRLAALCYSINNIRGFWGCKLVLMYLIENR